MFEELHRFIRDETIAHYGALSELISWFGWQPEEIFSEPVAGACAHLPAGSVDAVLRPRGADPVYVAVEAKGDSKKLNRLIREIDACTGEATHHEHNKCRALLCFRPRLFWGVACGSTRELYRVEYGERFVRLAPEPDESLLQRPADDT